MSYDQFEIQKAKDYLKESSLLREVALPRGNRPFIEFDSDLDTIFTHADNLRIEQILGIFSHDGNLLNDIKLTLASEIRTGNGPHMAGKMDRLTRVKGVREFSLFQIEGIPFTDAYPQLVLQQAIIQAAEEEVLLFLTYAQVLAPKLPAPAQVLAPKQSATDLLRNELRDPHNALVILLYEEKPHTPPPTELLKDDQQIYWIPVNSLTKARSLSFLTQNYHDAWKANEGIEFEPKAFDDAFACLRGAWMNMQPATLPDFFVKLAQSVIQLRRRAKGNDEEIRSTIKDALEDYEKLIAGELRNLADPTAQQTLASAIERLKTSVDLLNTDSGKRNSLIAPNTTITKHHVNLVLLAPGTGECSVHFQGFRPGQD